MDVSFAYDAIPKGSIRLIKVHNSDIFPPGDGIIDCSLQKFPLSESPPYTALSYVWGTDNPTRELRLNGKAILVRDNLHAFLCHIKPTPDDCLSVSDQKQYSPSYDEECRVRSMPTKDVPTAEVGYLWVDALCIDQGNNDEKMHQVAGMGRIYSRASRIVCWLGENCKDIIMDLLLEYGVESDEKKASTLAQQPFGVYPVLLPPVLEASVDSSRSINGKCSTTNVVGHKTTELGDRGVG